MVQWMQEMLAQWSGGSAIMEGSIEVDAMEGGLPTEMGAVASVVDDERSVVGVDGVRQTWRMLALP